MWNYFKSGNCDPPVNIEHAARERRATAVEVGQLYRK